MATDRDRAHMARALVLAERGRGTTSPNPLVGAVLVRDDEIVGEGWHERPGGPHAEVGAIEAAGERARGATAYVTLEPCDHQGRTGPCSRALLEAGVRRVVYAVADPDPLAAGGHRTLDAAGVEVEQGPLTSWAERQNEVFLHARRRRRPFVTLKLAQTVDGALHHGTRRWVTGPDARRDVHRRRARADAVLVGAGTAVADDPRLDARDVPTPGGQPRPVVLDTRGRTPVDAAVVRDGAVFLVGASAARTWRERVAERGAEVVEVATTGDRVDLREAMAALFERELHSVLAEPGRTLSGALVAARMVDRLVLHVATGLAGPHGFPRLTTAAQPPSGAGWGWRTESTGRLGQDLEVVAVPQERNE